MLASHAYFVFAYAFVANAVFVSSSSCPFDTTAQGAQAIQQNKLQGYCSNLLAKAATIKPTKVPSNFAGCTPLFVQQSCLEAANASPQCAPALYQNYGSIQRPENGDNLMQAAYYVNDKPSCCIACYGLSACVGYEFMPSSRDVNCAIFTTGGNSTSVDESGSESESNCNIYSSDSAPTFSGAGTSFKKDTLWVSSLLFPTTALSLWNSLGL